MIGVAEAARAVLVAAEPMAKVKAARSAARAWRMGRLDFRFDVAMPDRPARPAEPELLPINRMPKRGRGSDRGRTALIHALAHIEFAAIDLAFDMVGRFAAAFPRGFTDDWMHVGADEAMHFALLDRRLRQLDSHCARPIGAPRRGADGAGGARARRDAIDDRSVRGCG